MRYQILFWLEFDLCQVLARNDLLFTDFKPLFSLLQFFSKHTGIHWTEDIQLMTIKYLEDTS